MCQNYRSLAGKENEQKSSIKKYRKLPNHKKKQTKACI